MRFFRSMAAWVALIAGPGVASTSAQELVEPRPGDRVEWHTVQSGETLSAITKSYLGVADLWPENARLNPSIGEPDRLRIGQRIRVIITHIGCLSEMDCITFLYIPSKRTSQ